MKILLLAVAFPWPPNQWSTSRFFAATEYFKHLPDASVTLLAFTKFPGGLEAQIEELSPVFDRIKVFPLTRTEKIKRALCRPYTSLPWQIFGYQQPQMIREVRQAAQSNTWDIIYAMDIKMAPYLFSLTAGLRAVDYDISYSKYLKSALDDGSTPLHLRLPTWWEYMKMKAYESKTYSMADRCFISSSIDRDCISVNDDGTKWTILPNTVDTSYFEFGRPAANHRLVFVGRISYEPNRKGILHFCRYILPGIQKKVPDVELYIVGSKPPPEVLELHDGKTVVVTGMVDDIRPFLRDSSILVCPLNIGGGTRSKILEAMSAGIPVISSPLGCEGLAVTNGENIIIAQNDSDFIRDTVSLLHSPSQRQKLSRSARSFVETNYSRAIFNQALTSGLACFPPPSDQGYRSRGDCAHRESFSEPRN